MKTTNNNSLNQGMRSSWNVLAVSLIAAYTCAYLLVFFIPIYVVFFIPVVLLYFVAPKLKKLPTQLGDSTYKTGRLIGITSGLMIGAVGFIYNLGPVLDAINSNTVGDGSSIAADSAGVVANVMYIVALLVGYFRSR